MKPLQIPLTTHSDVDKILLHLQGHENYQTISAALQEKLDRMRVIRDWLEKYKSRLKVLPMVISEWKVSESTARRLFDETIEVYNVLAVPKGRNLNIEILLDAYWEVWRKAMADSDWKSATATLKEIRLVHLEFYGNEDAKRYQELQPPSIIIGYFIEKLNVKIPDDLEEQIRRMKAVKAKRNTTMFDDATEDAGNSD